MEQQAINKSDLIGIRGYKEEDKNFILSTFLLGFYHGDGPLSEMRKSVFMKHYHAAAENAIQTHEIRVAYFKEDVDTILGYSILLPEAVAWVFIKDRWRGIGLAKDLVPDTTKVFTHYNKVGLSIAKKYGWQYNPFYINELRERTQK